ncbi:hypothetical protein FS837_001164 [Tulasnella sp. UAMH 9824]|nr:hypothetical protein FS837_001164 [Tulasnella sp. UAMH 9824]
MQINRQANCSARAKGFVNKTRDFFSAFSNSFKYPEFKPFLIVTPTPEAQPPARVDPELEDEPGLVYPAPLFARRPTSSSGSTNSTSTGASTIFSRQSYRTASTVAGEGKESDKEKEKEDLISAADKASRVRVSQPSFWLRGESSGEESVLPSDEEEDDEEELLSMRSKRVEPAFATSLARPNPYAAFMSQPFYKPPYILPTTCLAVDTCDA